MGVVLGFGVIEEREREAITSALLGCLDRGEDDDACLARWNEKADEYDKMPRESAPQRYTRAWFYGGKIVFQHINRQHPFSPDGWAAMRIEVPVQDVDAGEREA